MNRDQQSRRTARPLGFTIVELLIVIVVIGILAAITIVAYIGIQKRAQDSRRASDVASIQKGLELYKADFGVYPAHITAASNFLPAGFTGWNGDTSSYSFSVATNGTWLKNLIDSKVVSSVPVDPINDSSHFYMYWASGASGFASCPAFYILEVDSPGAGSMKNSHDACCPGNGCFPTAANRAVFSNL